jgi:hypothetical protein
MGRKTRGSSLRKLRIAVFLAIILLLGPSSSYNIGALGSHLAQNIDPNLSSGSNSILKSNLATSSSAYSAPSGILTYVPITLNNYFGATISSNFQQKLTIDWDTYNSYLSAGVQNVGFFDSSWNPIYAWCESNCYYTDTSSVVWVKTDQPMTPTNPAITIYLGFYSPSTSKLNANGYWGECPNCYASNTYGKYDNGALVFNYYDNFINLNGWTTEHGSPSASNKLSIPAGSLLTNAGTSFSLYQSTLEAYVLSSITYGSQGDHAGFGFGVDDGNNPYTSGGSSTYWIQLGSSSGEFYSGIIDQFSTSSDLQAVTVDAVSYTNAGTTTTSTNSIWSLSVANYLGSETGILYVNYGDVSSSTTHVPPSGNYYISLGASTSASTTNYQWIRVRMTPPNEAMPTSTFQPTVQTSGIPSSLIGYVPIEISSDGNSYSSGLQQQLSIDFANYASYLNSNAENIEFYDSSWNNLNAWIESGAFSTTATATVWVKLDQAIAGNGAITIYLGFLPTSDNEYGINGPVGVAPQLSVGHGGYGIYDNGASVFNYYDNFSTSSGLNNWDKVTGSPTSSSGLTVPAGTILSETGTSFSLYSSTFEAYVSSITYGSQGDHAGFGFGKDSSGNPYTSDSGSYWIGIGTGSGQFYNGIIDQYSTSSDLEVTTVSSGSWTSGLTTSTKTSAVWGLTTSSSEGELCVNYGYPNGCYATTSDIPPSGSYYMSIGASKLASQTVYDWIRVRTTPTGNFMPLASYGPVAGTAPMTLVYSGASASYGSILSAYQGQPITAVAPQIFYLDDSGSQEGVNVSLVSTFTYGLSNLVQTAHSDGLKVIPLVEAVIIWRL